MAATSTAQARPMGEDIPENAPRSETVARVIHVRPSPGQFERLVSEHVDLVWRSLRRFGVPEADVDDATQQVFLVASDKFSQIQPGRERAFLLGVATRVASHARRTTQRRDVAVQRLSLEVEEPQPVNPNPEELTEKLEARELLDRVLDAMPDDLRAVFALFELEELTVDQIAIVLEIPRGTAATRLRRSRQVFHQQAQRLKSEIESTSIRSEKGKS